MNEETTGPRYVLYDANEAPHDVYNLTAFCQEQGLDPEAIRNVVRGKQRRYRGWHLDDERTERRNKLAREIQAMLEESEEKYGVAFVLIKDGRGIPENR